MAEVFKIRSIDDITAAIAETDSFLDDLVGA